MRLLFILMLLIFSIAVKAQTAAGSNYSYLQPHLFTDNNYLKDSTPGKKWFVSKYAGISSGISFFNDGNATVLAVPVGIQINRKITDNWYAFAELYAAPAYINFNHAFSSANINKIAQPNNYFLRSNRFDMYSRAAMELMYINDQKTFSISGSIGVQRSSYPLIPYNQMNTAKPVFIPPHQ
jgi:hypothetical protein